LIAWVTAEHGGGDGGGCQPHQDHVVLADPVEAVQQRVAALDLVRLDRVTQHVAHGQRLAAFAFGLAAEVITHRQDAAQVVRRVAPFGGQPGVVEIEPADLRADRERRLHRIQLMAGPRHARAARQRGSRHHRAEVLHALGELHRHHRGGQRVQQHVARGVVGLLRVDLVVDHVIGDVDQRLVGIGTDGGTDVVRTHGGISWRGKTAILADWHPTRCLTAERARRDNRRQPKRE